MKDACITEFREYSRLEYSFPTSKYQTLRKSLPWLSGPQTPSEKVFRGGCADKKWNGPMALYFNLHTRMFVQEVAIMNGRKILSCFEGESAGLKNCGRKKPVILANEVT